MKIQRSTKCSLKFTTTSKRKIISQILEEYSRVVNCYIDIFWIGNYQKTDIKKEIVHLVDSWFTYRMRQCAAREALELLQSILNKKINRNKDRKNITKPIHKGNKANLSSLIVDITKSRNSFDIWIILDHFAKDRIKLEIPIKKHKHFNKFENWEIANSIILTNNYIQFIFKTETGKKKTEGELLGIDVGINHLLATSKGELFGSETKTLINVIKRKKQNSKSYKRAKKTLLYYFNKTVKDSLNWVDLRLVVVERLKNLKYEKKGKSKNFRKTLSNWNYRELLNIIQLKCEENRVSFRSINPYMTSQTCPACSHAEWKNREGEKFKCLKCGYSDQADVVGSLNILTRFLIGPYGADFQTC